MVFVSFYSVLFFYMHSTPVNFVKFLCMKFGEYFVPNFLKYNDKILKLQSDKIFCALSVDMSLLNKNLLALKIQIFLALGDMGWS